MAGELPESTFEDILRLHERMVLRLALRLTGNLADAQDAAQEVFLRLHRHLSELKGSDGAVRWLHRVTVNVCFDFGRRRRVSRTVALGSLVLVSREPTAEEQIQKQQQDERLQQALNQLGDRERVALVLRELEGLSTAEVAVVVGVAESTVRVQIANARLKLRKILREL